MPISRDAIEDLKRRYPGCPIKELPEGAPEEVVCETYRAPDESWSTAVALIERSKPHIHRWMLEVYVPMAGAGTLHRGPTQWSQMDSQHQGAELIYPGTPHWVTLREGQSHIEVLVVCKPAWTLRDHHLIQR
jgi:mannose-6-phosphate isomerase-like protein (cupin superfamily)